ncbi:MAG: glycosyltransferase family 39 protein [Phycisphaerales bacterium]|nr:glycosyltransferase family 39 protein [Phycisphaerales bacterium]
MRMLKALAQPGRWYTPFVIAPGVFLLALFIALHTARALPPIDRDECRFAQASRQMFESTTLPAHLLDLRVDEKGVPKGLHAGSWAVPMFAETPRLNKPPLIYWLQSLSARVLTDNRPLLDAIWMYRVPSAICYALSCAALYLLARGMVRHHAALLASILLLVSPMMLWDALQARSDELLTFTTLLTMAALWGIWSRRDQHTTPLGRTLRAAAFWLCMGLGILSKGPITPMIAGLCIISLCIFSKPSSTNPSRCRWLLQLNPLLGIVILALTLAPWLIAIDHAVGLPNYARIVYDEFVLRGTTGSREGHFAPPGFHLLLSAALLWPASLVFIDALRRAWKGRLRTSVSVSTITTTDPTATTQPPRRRWSFRSLIPTHIRDVELFLLAWLVPAWIVFELSPAKLPHYPMPLYPAACILCAAMLFTREHDFRRTIRTTDETSPAPSTRLAVGDIIWIVIACIPFLLCGIFVTYALLSPSIQPPLSTTNTITLIGLAIYGCFGVYSAAKVLRTRRALWIGFFAIIISLPALSVAIRTIGPRTLPGSLTARLFKPLTPVVPLMTLPDNPLPFASVYHEDSVVFWSRGRAERLHTSAMLDWLRARPRAAAIIDERQLAEAQALGCVSIYSTAGENSTMPKGQRDTILHVVIKGEPFPSKAQQP